MEWIIKTELLHPIRPLLEAGMIDAAMTLLFTNIQKDGKYYTKAVKMEGPVSFHDIAVHCAGEVIGDMISELMSGKKPKHAWLTPEAVTAYYARSMVFAFEEWVKTGMCVSPQEMSEAYQYIMTRSLTDIIKEL